MANSLGLSVGVAMVCLCAAPAHGEMIYQCVGKDGAEVLQNFPCQAQSEVWVQKDMREAKGAPRAPSAAEAPARAAPAVETESSGGGAADRQDVTNTRADASAAPGDTAAADGDELTNLPSEPAAGMTPRQVQAILGEPTEITQEEVVEGRVVTWAYSESRVLRFDTTGRLLKK